MNRRGLEEEEEGCAVKRARIVNECGLEDDNNNQLMNFDLHQLLHQSIQQHSILIAAKR